MPQLHLPLFPSGATEITPAVSFSRTEETVTYFHCGLPVFSHDVNNRAEFLLTVAQLYVVCGVLQATIARALGIPTITIKRAVKRYRLEGARGFFAPRITRGAAVLTPPLLKQAQIQLDDGLAPSQVADALGIKLNTLDKAIRGGRLHQAPKKKRVKASTTH